MAKDMTEYSISYATGKEKYTNKRSSLIGFTLFPLKLVNRLAVINHRYFLANNKSIGPNLETRKLPPHPANITILSFKHQIGYQSVPHDL